MRRTLVAITTLGLAFAALACGGGGSDDDGRTYAPTVVSIKHIDFTGMELTATDISNTPSQYAERYPGVVATVNGEPVTGAALAHAEIGIEWKRRQDEEADIFHLITPSDL